MKKRGMHWSAEDTEAMVKIIQGMVNGTLLSVYLKHQERNARKHCEVKRVAKKAEILYQKTRPSIGVKDGHIPLNGPNSSALGQLIKGFQISTCVISIHSLNERNHTGYQAIAR
jgi:hypothetical protein